MRKGKVNTTKLEIIQVASRMFSQNGYTQTSARAICAELGIGLGHMNFYFPSKEDLLAVLVDMLCGFQWKLMQEETKDGHSPLLALCFELTSMASAAEESEIARDFFVSSYISEKTLELIRKNDVERAKKVFAEYCTDWTHEQFVEAEVLVSGIEYATLRPTASSTPLDVRIKGALNAIMMIYNVPEEVRQKNIDCMLALDYRKMGRRIFGEFKEYIEQTTEQAFEEAQIKKEKN